MEQMIYRNNSFIQNGVRANCGFINKLFSILIILLPFLYQYKSPLEILSLGDFLLIIGSTICVFYDILSQKKIKICYQIIFFVFGLLIINFIPMFTSGWFSIEDFSTIFLKMIMYTIVIEVAYNHFSFLKVKKMYLWFCVLLSFYLILQYFYTKATNNYLPIYIKYDWLFSWEKRVKDLNEYYGFVYYKFRPSSLFLEPSYFALYVIPCLYLTLIFEKKYLLSLLISFALILSTSGAGIGLMAIIYVCFFIKLIIKLVEERKVSKVVEFFLFFSTIMIALFLILFSSLFSRVLGGSFGARISRGFIIFGKMNLNEQLFGVGINNLSNYLKMYSIRTIYDEINLNYNASISSVLVQNGFFGIIILLIFAIFIYRKNKKIISFLILLFALLCFEDVLFNFRFGFYISIMFSFNKEFEILNIKWNKKERSAMQF